MDKLNAIVKAFDRAGVSSRNHSRTDLANLALSALRAEGALVEWSTDLDEGEVQDGPLFLKWEGKLRIGGFTHIHPVGWYVNDMNINPNSRPYKEKPEAWALLPNTQEGE